MSTALATAPTSGRGLTYERPVVGGPMVERVWTCVAADDGEGRLRPDLVGTKTIVRLKAFAFRAEADEWRIEQEAEGFRTCLSGYATFYFGPTDADCNCWLATAEKEAL